MITQNLLKRQESIAVVISRVMRKLEERRRVIVRCTICEKIHIPKKYSKEHKNQLCNGCLSAYNHIYAKESKYDV